MCTYIVYQNVDYVNKNYAAVALIQQIFQIIIWSLRNL